MVCEVETIWYDRLPKESKLKTLFGNVQTREEKIEVSVNKRYMLQGYLVIKVDTCPRS